MNEEKLRELFPNASAAFIAANSVGARLQDPVPEPVVRHEPMGADKGKTQSATRFAVGITSFRMRELDPDNLAGGCKYVVDALRYGRLIPNDSPKDIDLTIRQKKVASKEQERTEIEIAPIN